LVTDLARSADFYENILGLTPIKRPDLGFSGLWYGVGDLQLHLLQLTPPLRHPVLPSHVGRDWHLAMMIDSLVDLEDLKQKLMTQNIPYTLSRSGRNALFCRDPDLNGLEFVVNQF
jgi:glyoxylase I family protein